MSPITHGNWEGIGVVPDVQIEEAKALPAAYRLALKGLIAASDAAHRQSLQDILDTLK